MILNYFNFPVMIRTLRTIFLLFFSALLIPSGYSQAVDDSVVDGVVAIVGANVILKSDIEAQYLQYRMQGDIRGGAEKIKCQLFETMLFQKLLLNQAQVDSATVTDAQVESELDRRLRYFINQIGSPEKLEEYYQKTLVQIKNEMRDIIKEQMLIEVAQQKITKEVTVTPSEVKAFYKDIPKDSIPEIASEYEIGIISKKPVVGEAEKEEVITRLKDFKQRVAKGDDFSTLAILYSEDPGSSKQGGELGLFKRGEMRTEFEAAAFKLKPGEVSDIVETEDGYHIIQMIEKRGEYINVRHILLQPKVSYSSMNKARTLLDSVRNMIIDKKMTFDQAVLRFSDDPTRNNGGIMVNPATGAGKFESAQLDPKVFFVVDKLKAGDISQAVLYKNDRGKEEYRLYYLKSRTVPHKANLEEDYYRIQSLALERKKMDVVNQWILQKIKKTYISIIGQYGNCNFEREWQKK